MPIVIGPRGSRTAKYGSLCISAVGQWRMMDLGGYPSCVLDCKEDATLRAQVESKTDTLVLPSDLNKRIGTERTGWISKLEARGFPADWLSGTATILDSVKLLQKMCQFYQRFGGMGGGVLGSYLHMFAGEGGRTLDSRISDLPTSYVTRLRAAAESLQINHGNVRGTTTLREMLRILGEQWNGQAPSPGTMDPSDSFTNTNGTALPTHNSAWVEEAGSFAIDSNSVYSDNGANPGLARYGATYANDQFAQATVVAVASSSPVLGVSVRIASGAVTAYSQTGRGNFGVTDQFLEKIVAGTSTDMVQDSNNWAVSDVVRIEAVGTTITGDRNGTEEMTTTDSAIASGDAGIISVFSNSTTRRLDTWSGGDVGGTAYSLTLSPGSYSVTGTVVSLERGYSLTLSPGSYSIAGTVVSLTSSGTPSESYVLAIDPGAYLVTLEDMTLLVAGKSCIAVISKEEWHSFTRITMDFLTDLSGFAQTTFHMQGQVYSITTWPYGTPTNLWDLKILNRNDGDILMGQLEDRSSTSVEVVHPFDGIEDYKSLPRIWDLQISNAGSAKRGQVGLVILRKKK